jgi:anti-sigma B factor antagonist
MSTSRTTPTIRASHGEPIMSLDLAADGVGSLITVRGEVDMSNAHLIVELAEYLIRDRPARLVLDLSAVAFFGAHGVGALLQVRTSAADCGVPMFLARPGSCVTYILAVTGALADFDLQPSAEAAGVPRQRRGT